MTNAELLLNGDYSVSDIKSALQLIISEYNTMLSKIIKKQNVKELILGDNLDKIFSRQIEGNIELTTESLLGNEYKLLNKEFSISANNFITEDEDIISYSYIRETLESNFVKKDMLFDEKQVKENVSTNAISVNDLDILNGIDVISKSATEINVNKASIEYVDLSNDLSIISVDLFNNLYYTKNKVFRNIKLSISNLNSLIVHNSSFKEILLDYTLDDVVGAGVKITDFIEKDAAVEPTPAIVNVMVNVLYPDNENTLTINGNNYSYTPSVDDTPDIVADSIGGEIDIDGVSYELAPGYYSGNPEDDDGEHKLGWYLPDTTDGLSPSVSLQSDNSSEHDIEVDWDDEEKTLVVTYASDGSDTLYPTIGELIDAVQENSPVKVVITDPSYTTDDDYPYEMDFDLEQTDSLLTITSTNVDINVDNSSPDGVFEVNKIQDYHDGIHQSGDITVVQFRRGYNFYIKIDDTEYSIDTTDDSNPDITNSLELVSKFVDLINEDGIAVANSSNDTITLISKDYTEHEVTTSGEIDYKAPLTREVYIKYDLRNYLEQGSESVLYKDGINLTSKSPLTNKELSILVDNGIFFNNNHIADPKLKKDNTSYKYTSTSDDGVSTLFESVAEIKSMYEFDKNIFMSKKLEYITINDLFINANINFPDESEVDKYKIITAPKTEIISSKQIKYFYEMSLETVEKVFLSFDDKYYSIMLNTFSNYLNNESIASLNDIYEKPNTNNKAYFMFSSQKAEHIFTSIYGFIGNKIYYRYTELDKLKRTLFVEYIKSNTAFFLNKEKKVAYAFYKNIDKAIVETISGVSELTVKTVNDLLKTPDEIHNLKDSILIAEGDTESNIKEIVLQNNVNQDDDDESVDNTVYEYYKENIYNNEYFIKHMLMSVILEHNAPNVLEQLINLLDTFFFDINDVSIHLSNEFFRDVVMEMDIDDPDPEMTYGLDGTPESTAVTFADLYIRQYKPYLKQTTSTDMSTYVTDEYKNMSIEEKVIALRLVPTNIDNRVYPICVTKNPIVEDGNMFDSMLYRDIVVSGYFGNNVSLFLNKSLSGVSDEYMDTIWNALIKTIFIKDEDNIIGVKDSTSIIKIIYDRFTNTDKYLFAALLGSYRDSEFWNNVDNVVSTMWNNETNESALLNLFIRIYEALKRNNIADSDYEEYFNKYVGAIFVDDIDATDILPYDLFEYFISACGFKQLISESGDTSVNFDSTKFWHVASQAQRNGYWKYINSNLVLELKDS